MILLQKKDFKVSQVFRPTDKEIEDEKVISEAMDRINNWLRENSEIKVVNVESIYLSVSQSMGTTTAELSLLRVWFN